jgi:C-terminal processing protease CtpA/Prc
MFRKVICLLVFKLSVVACIAQLPDTLRSHIDSAIDIMKEHSLYADQVDWNNARSDAYLGAATAKNKEDLFKVIANIFTQLKDHHGWFEQYNDKLKLNDSSAIKRYTPSLIAEWAKGPTIKIEMIEEIAYLRIPGMPAYKQQQVDFYANWLADSISSLAARKPRGWIIDLRLNTGGNITPMMSALSAFFQDGILSYYVDRNGRPVSTSTIKKGIFYLDDTVHANLRKTPPRLNKSKVALIIGPGTASSAEGVAAIFQERKKTRLFGEATAGVANATQGFVFNRDNSYFLLTTAALGNKKKKRLPAYITPDVKIIHNDSFDHLSNDHAVIETLNWLK